MKQLTRAGIALTLAVAVVAAPASSAVAKGSKKQVSVTKRSTKTMNVKKPRLAVTKMSFKLDAQEFDAGDDTIVTGAVRLLARSGRTWAPIAGASVSVSVDHVAFATVVTDEAGRATIEVPVGDPGEHVVKVRYAGDSSRRPAARAQGFDTYGTWYADADGDGYGDAAAPMRATEQPDGTVQDATDCDDVDPAVNPGAAEVADNAVDDDCDGQVDETDEPPAV